MPKCGGYPPARHSFLQCRVVALVLVGVRNRELCDRVVEDAGLPEVACDRVAVTGPGVGAGECPGAHPAPELHSLGSHPADVGGPFPVAQLADVEVAFVALQREPFPAEEDVARRLHQPLAANDAFALVGEFALAREWLEHGRPGFFDLQEQGVATSVDEQQDPCLGADAANADDLAREVDDPVLVEQVVAIGRERPRVEANHLAHAFEHGLPGSAVEELLNRGDQRRVADDPWLAVEHVAELVEGLMAVASRVPS